MQLKINNKPVGLEQVSKETFEKQTFDIFESTDSSIKEYFRNKNFNTFLIKGKGNELIGTYYKNNRILDYFLVEDTQSKYLILITDTDKETNIFKFQIDLEKEEVPVFLENKSVISIKDWFISGKPICNYRQYGLKGHMWLGSEIVVYDSKSITELIKRGSEDRKNLHRYVFMKLGVIYDVFVRYHHLRSDKQEDKVYKIIKKGNIQDIQNITSDKSNGVLEIEYATYDIRKDIFKQSPEYYLYFTMEMIEFNLEDGTHSNRGQKEVENPDLEFLGKATWVYPTRPEVGMNTLGNRLGKRLNDKWLYHYRPLKRDYKNNSFILDVIKKMQYKEIESFKWQTEETLCDIHGYKKGFIKYILTKEEDESSVFNLSDLSPKHKIVHEYIEMTSQNCWKDSYCSFSHWGDRRYARVETYAYLDENMNIRTTSTEFDYMIKRLETVIAFKNSGSLDFLRENIKISDQFIDFVSKHPESDKLKEDVEITLVMENMKRKKRHIKGKCYLLVKSDTVDLKITNFLFEKSFKEGKERIKFTLNGNKYAQYIVDGKSETTIKSCLGQLKDFLNKKGINLFRL